jgi:hypothetical protein
LHQEPEMRAEFTLFSIVVAAALSAATVVVLSPPDEAFMPAGDKPDGQEGGAARKRQQGIGPGQRADAELSTHRTARQTQAGARSRWSGNHGQASR